MQPIQEKRVRPVSLAVIRHPRNDTILAVCFRRDDTGEPYYRPAGGGIDYGETSEAAVRREIREELGAEIVAQRLLTVAENIFTDERGELAHQIMFLWEVSFVDPALYEQEIFIDHDDIVREAHWVSPADLAARGIPLFPVALREAL